MFVSVIKPTAVNAHFKIITKQDIHMWSPFFSFENGNHFDMQHYIKLLRTHIIEIKCEIVWHNSASINSLSDSRSNFIYTLHEISQFTKKIDSWIVSLHPKDMLDCVLMTKRGLKYLKCVWIFPEWMIEWKMFFKQINIIHWKLP